MLHLTLNPKPPAISECVTAETIEAERDRLGIHVGHIGLLLYTLKFLVNSRVSQLNTHSDS